MANKLLINVSQQNSKEVRPQPLSRLSWPVVVTSALIALGTVVAQEPSSAKAADVVIDSLRKMIAFDEEDPGRYVGSSIRVLPTVGWIDPLLLRRDKSVGGYVMRWKCGENFNGAEEFGTSLLRQETLNYVVNTELAISILEKLQKGRSHRCGLTFTIAAEQVGDKQVFIARLQQILPGQNSALDRAKAQAEIDAINRGR